MLISLCVPIHNRLRDLARTLPCLLATANASPPTEVLILDYNSTDGLEEWVRDKSVTYLRYTGRPYFHKAHAFNLALLSGIGRFVALLGADAMPHRDYVKALRELIAQDCIWMRGDKLRGIVCVQKAEFIAAGGYDERFELYGPEDRDLEDRLVRRGGKFGLVPDGLMSVIPTSDRDKIKHYRLKLSKRGMSKLMRPIYEENVRCGVMVANEGGGWGQWN